VLRGDLRDHGVAVVAEPEGRVAGEAGETVA
jgi:hypothetical protein